MRKLLATLILLFLPAAAVAQVLPSPGNTPASSGGSGLTTIVTYYATVGCEKSVGETINGWWTHNSASSPATQCDNTGLGQRLNGRLTYPDAGGVIFASFPITLPADQSGDIDVRIFWSTTVTTGDVEWNVGTVCMGDDDAYSPALNTYQQVVDTAGGTANDLMIVALATVTQTGCAAGEVMNINIARDGADAQDTIAASAFLHGVEVTITRTPA